MSRWTSFRNLGPDLYPTTPYEAQVFLDNAFWHLRNTGRNEWPDIEARRVINSALSDINLKNMEAA